MPNEILLIILIESDKYKCTAHTLKQLIESTKRFIY